MIPFSNPETRAVFLELLFDRDAWDDPCAVAREWLEVCQGSAMECLAQQLKKDFYQYYTGDGSQPLFDTFMRRGLRRVNWQEVARQPLKRFGPREQKAAEEKGDADGAAGTA